jgi:DNA-binding transcriptional MerR regulator
MGGYRIGEVADATGFTTSTLRYYEDEGLLPAPERTAAGQRVYSDAHVERLRFMARGKRLGLTLEEIADLADAWEDEDCAVTQEQLLELLEDKLADVHDEIVELTTFADQLQEIHQRVAGRPAEHGRCGPDCGCAPALTTQPAIEPAERRFGQVPVGPGGS